MKKKLQKAGLFGSAALFLCSAVLGIAVMPINALADGSTMSTTGLILDKTSNVTVAAAQTFTMSGQSTKEYNGLQIGPSNLADDWSADINALFTDDASITWLGNRAGSSTSNVQDAAVAFSVINKEGETVCTYVHRDGSWTYMSSPQGYLYNPADNLYTTIWSDWGSSTGGKTAGFLKDDSGEYRMTTLTPNATATGGLKVASGTWSDMYISPILGANDNLGESKVTEHRGTLYFDYDATNQEISVKVSSFDVAGREDTHENASGQGQILPMGSVKADLSAGYTIRISNAPDIVDASEGVYAYKYSSRLTITNINGMDVSTATVNIANAGTESISYANEYVKDEKNMIDLAYGEKLGEFSYVMSDKSVADAQNNTLVLNPTNATFTYSDDIFTADEDITVAYGGASKAYTVSVSESAATIATSDLLTAISDCTIESSKTITDRWAESTVGTWTGIRVTPSGGTDNNINTRDTIVAKFNGVFYGNSSFSFAVLKNTSGGFAQAFTVYNASEQAVLTIVSTNSAWGNNDNGRAYVYDYATQKYTTASATGVTEITSFEELTASSVKAVLPNYIGGTTYGQGTYSFIYDETAKTLTVKAATYAGTDVTLGVVNADLSKGYTIQTMNAGALTEGNIPTSATVSTGKWYAEYGQKDTGFANTGYLVITAINGYSLAGETVGANKAETVFAPSVTDNDGAIALVKGADTPTFDATFTYNLGSFVGTKAATYEPAFDTMVTGTSELTVETEWGASKTYSVTVKTLSDSLSTLGMRAGAQVRTKEPYGLRFTMQMRAEDMAFVNANVGEGKYYTAASYGMFILPYDYIASAAPTEENLFGENAKYTWLKKADGVGSVRIMHSLSDRGMTIGRGAEYFEETDTYYLYYAITSLAQENITRKFVSVGYIALETADGVEYKVVSLYDGYTEDGDNSANNVRSAYDVAAAAFEDTEMDDAELKDWLYDNYLYGNDNNKYTDPDTTTVPVGKKEEEV